MFDQPASRKAKAHDVKLVTFKDLKKIISLEATIAQQQKKHLPWIQLMMVITSTTAATAS
jgi:hypothetical protein